LNVYLARQPCATAEKARLIFNITDGKLYINTGVSYVSIATGGDAATLQVELDALESALGTLFTSSGGFNGSAISFASIDNSSTTLSQVISKLDTAIANKPSSIHAATDASLTTLSNKDILYYESSTGKWKNAQP
jgi:hypothetical protein